jgi:riboflavin kinase / FMN adenylyltransferase
MELVNGQVRLYDKYSGISIALGTFDGVHLGHREIIRRVITTAKCRGGTSVVFTFEPHPRTVLNPYLPLPLLTTYDEKRAIIASLGVDVLFTLPFHVDFSRISPEGFVRDILVELVRPELVVVGPNYTFGCEGQGNPELLANLGEKYGFKVEVVRPVFLEGQMVSSTMIRKMINQGDVANARKLLARYFTLSGKVVAGDGRGRTLGYPTANVAFPPSAVLPSDGVYAVWVVVDQNIHPGVANIGSNPTFGVSGRRLEVHLLDFQADLYNHHLTIELVQHLRDEKTFSGAEELISQIEKDVTIARNILTAYE